MIKETEQSEYRNIIEEALGKVFEQMRDWHRRMRHCMPLAAPVEVATQWAREFTR